MCKAGQEVLPRVPAQAVPACLPQLWELRHNWGSSTQSGTCAPCNISLDVGFLKVRAVTNTGRPGSPFGEAHSIDARPTGCGHSLDIRGKLKGRWTPT